MKNISNWLFKVAVFIIPILLNSCKPDNPTKAPSKEMYIQFSNIKVICKVPAVSYQTFLLTTGDTSVSWQGNINGLGDTMIQISHFGPRILGKKYKLNVDYNDPDAVIVSVLWSNISGQPCIILTGGDYTLEKENGKWVSVVKNGVGIDGLKFDIKYSGIECRIIWP